ncbi:MAG: hypothetical protein ACOC0D_00435 [Spirochaeta sp.]
MQHWRYYIAKGFPQAAEKINVIRTGAAAELQADPSQALETIRPETAVLTLLAGSGSRWAASVQAAAEAGIPTGFDTRKPRGLFPVQNLLPSHICNQKTLPIAAYSLAAVKGLGSHIIMTSGYEREIEQEILQPLGFQPDTYRFQQQKLFQGKPLGHGAAALQAKPFWEKYRYVICNFGGDANNRQTVKTALLALAGLDAAGENTGLLLPAAFIENPAYTIKTDSQGRPIAFHHAKLTGREQASGRGWSNVGLRLYRSEDLAEALDQLHKQHWSSEYGYQVPGNQGNELALDNADAYLAERRRARLLAIAQPEEITPAKTLDAIPGFLHAVSSLPGMRSLTSDKTGV